MPDHALWRNDRLPFQVEFFHRGFFFDKRVDIFEVDQGQARRIAYSPSMFSFGDLKSPDANTDLGFAGFRLHYPINRPDYFDEFAVFLGATYFRAVAKGQGYGLSARGLAINTGDPKGEEFPAFTSFWIERPQPNATSIVVHALLESPSTTGAYRFTIRPGQETTFDVEPVLFPRTDIAQAGIAPLTSMFLFDANDRKNVDDYRSAVHDSDGLAIHNGRDERLWRQLNNPSDLQISSFGDTNPRGFGLMQRQKSFGAYEDLESHFERRPSLWVEPIGDWGEGEVRLVEIPTKEEFTTTLLGYGSRVWLWQPRANTVSPTVSTGNPTMPTIFLWPGFRPPVSGQDPAAAGCSFSISLETNSRKPCRRKVFVARYPRARAKSITSFRSRTVRQVVGD